MHQSRDTYNWTEVRMREDVAIVGNNEGVSIYTKLTEDEKTGI